MMSNLDEIIVIYVCYSLTELNLEVCSMQISVTFRVG